MSKVKTKSKRKIDSKNVRLKEALRTLPVISHFGDPPVEFMSEFKRCLRIVSLKPRHGVRYDSEVSQLQLITQVIDLFSPTVIARHCPPWQFHLVPRSPRSVRAYWTKIASTDVNGRTIYHWRNHWLNINGGRYRVGWQSHFMTQLMERLADEKDVWMRLISAELLTNLRMEVDGDGVWLWKDIHASSLWNDFIKEFHAADYTDYEQRMAYCPVEYVGKFARLKTCLLPHMRVPGVKGSLITPEREYGRDSRCWEEILKIHEKLPMIRRKKAARFC